MSLSPRQPDGWVGWTKSHLAADPHLRGPFHCSCGHWAWLLEMIDEINPTWKQRAFPSPLKRLTCVLLSQHPFTGVVPGKGVSRVTAAIAYSSHLV